jgi:dolichyl-phosphate-mannose-protein mannosyltransferase
MSVFKNLAAKQFWIGMFGIFIVSAGLRFWGLSRFNVLVFDEVYYAIFANNYLTKTPFFNAHPPLSQYLIAIGIWLGQYLPFGKDITNNLTGSEISTFSYRWFNAFTGSFIPLVVGAVAYQLHPKRSYALIAALFAAADGLFLVESRYALNNIYLVLFGLLGQLCVLIALKKTDWRRWCWLAFGGVWFGASAAIKWNGLWFLLGIYLLWIGAWIIRWRSKNRESANLEPMAETPLANFTQFNILHIILNLGIIPIVVYSVSWIPHLILNPSPNFLQMQKEILVYHQGVGNGASVHPYCANWYTWPLMIRPLAYFYHNTAEVKKVVSDIPDQVGNSSLIYDVHAMGNPILWWLSTAAILLVLVVAIQRLLNINHPYAKSALMPSTWIALYLVANYAANLLPWARVTRCVFLYHYMGASVFSGLALAWIVDRWLQHEKKEFRDLGWGIIGFILLAFVFWMPIYLGLPLSPAAYQWRMWFPSWI